MVGGLQGWWRRRRARRVAFSERDFEQGFRIYPPLAAVPISRRPQLAALAREFLADKTFHGARGFEVDLGMRTRIAQLACLPVLNLGYDCLLGWHDVIVYPGGFRARRQEIDEDSGLAHEWEEDLAGESWDQGPLVLSWDDLITDLAHPEDIQNVVFHEIAHKLDARSGAADGAPPLPRRIDPAGWTRTFQTAFETLGRQVENDPDRAPIDPYAASAPEEFFAVASEYHFIAPVQLHSAFPEVAELIARYYAGPA